MSEHLELGHTITTEQHRDAVHVAVIPIEAETPLNPGSHVGVSNGKARQSYAHIGVVDPFLKEVVQEGEKFWLFLYPGSIKSLRHEWLHPAFDNGIQDEEGEGAIKFINQLSEETGICYDELLKIGIAAIKNNWATAGDDNDSHVLNENRDQFIKSVSRITGLKVKDLEGIYFSCSC